MSEVDKLLHDSPFVPEAQKELIRINDFCQELLRAAKIDDQNGHDQWQKIYSVIFSDSISVRVRKLFDNLNRSFSYYDPDTSYREDVEAFIVALGENI